MTGRTAPSRARQVVRKGDILFSTVRTYLRNIALIDKDYPNPIASTGFTVIRPAEGVSPQFLFYQVLTDDFLRPLHALQTGTSYPAVRDRDVFAQPILLPPFAEQVRIASKLGMTLTRIRKGEESAHRALKRLQHYRDTVLRAAVTGDLTHEWRESRRRDKNKNTDTGFTLLQQFLAIRKKRWEEAELVQLRKQGKEPLDDSWKSSYTEPLLPDISDLPTLPREWSWASLEMLAEINSGIMVSRNRLVKNPVELPYLRVANVLRGYLDLSDIKTIRIEKEKFSEYLLKPGDILFTEGGDRDKLGRGWIWEGQIPKCTHQNHVFRARLADQSLLAPRLVSYWGNTYGQQFFLEHAVQTTNLASINRAVLSKLPVPLPPIDEQHEILNEVEKRLVAADRMAQVLDQQLARADTSRQLLLSEAFSGSLVSQDDKDESGDILLERIRSEKAKLLSDQKESRSRSHVEAKKVMSNVTKGSPLTPENLSAAFDKIGRKPNVELLYKELECAPEQITAFYETLRATPKVLAAFQIETEKTLSKYRISSTPLEKKPEQNGHFRLVELWLENFKNLKDYSVRFETSQGLDVVLGWNGTGKSNLFEALVIIFRDLSDWWLRNRWPEQPVNGYRLLYEISEQLIQVVWNPAKMKRPLITKADRMGNSKEFGRLEEITRTELILPRFLFAYYSGPTNRLADIFQPMNLAHYERLRDATSDNPKTLASLLEQRRFFCAETHHAKYVLLAFSYKEDLAINTFLKDRLRIIGFESALFIIRKPAWAKKGSTAEDFWGAKGIMRRVMERLRRYAIAPMVIRQTVNDGYRSKTEDHYYFFLPDHKSLTAFAAEYENARTFFLALESTDFSELIYDLIIQVRIQDANGEEPLITFHQLSEGEQQLLMVLGLLRFTKSNQSLVLLDEPDTHLNPHWGVIYLKDLKRVMSDNDLESPEQQTSQILMATHDPLVIASLVKEQIHLLKRDIETLECFWEQPSVDPRGLGFTGILTSEMFGFRSDLDPETMDLLDRQVDLAGKDRLSHEEMKELENITKQVESLGFKSANSDPYYRAFIKAIVRRQEVRNLLLKPVLGKQDFETLKRETDEILAEIEAEEARGK